MMIYDGFKRYWTIIVFQSDLQTQVLAISEIIDALAWIKSFHVKAT